MAEAHGQNSPTSRFWLIFLAFALLGCTYYAKDWWKQSRHLGDGGGYYMHLPSALLYQDVGDYTRTFEVLKQYHPNMADPRADIYGFRPSPTGKIVDKYPIGPALLQLPFFALAHGYAHFSGKYPADGFSEPYQSILAFSTLWYVLLGAWLLYLVLRRYFPEKVVQITLIAVVLGTNLLHFAAFNSSMAHGFQFFSLSGLIYFTEAWYRKPSYRNAIGIGGMLGLIAIIRSQDLIFGLVPLLWGVSRHGFSFSDRLLFALSNLPTVLAAILAFFVVILPQLAYFRFVSGKWYYYTYVGEKFNWSKPRIFDGLFDPSNGWFLYTPLMLLPVLGFLIFWIKKPKSSAQQAQNQATEPWFLPTGLVLLLHIYLAYSWWCWNYIAGLGSRPMVDVYALLAFPLAQVLYVSGKNKFSAAIVWGLTAIFCLLSIKFTWQQYNGHIFSERHNKAFYLSMLPKLRPDRESLIALHTNRIQPDTNALTWVKTLKIYDFEAENNPFPVEIPGSTSGKSVSMREEWVKIDEWTSENYPLKRGDWLRIRMRAYAPEEGRIGDSFSTGLFLLNQHHSPDKPSTWLTGRPTNLIGNATNNIWSTGELNQWGEIEYFLKIRQDLAPSGKIELTGFNPARQNWVMDDLRVDLFLEK